MNVQHLSAMNFFTRYSSAYPAHLGLQTNLGFDTDTGALTLPPLSSSPSEPWSDWTPVDCTSGSSPSSTVLLSTGAVSRFAWTQIATRRSIERFHVMVDILSKYILAELSLCSGKLTNFTVVPRSSDCESFYMVSGAQVSHDTNWISHSPDPHRVNYLRTSPINWRSLIWSLEIKSQPPHKLDKLRYPMCDLRAVAGPSHISVVSTIQLQTAERDW